MVTDTFPPHPCPVFVFSYFSRARTGRGKAWLFVSGLISLVNYSSGFLFSLAEGGEPMRLEAERAKQGHLGVGRGRGRPCFFALGPWSHPSPCACSRLLSSLRRKKKACEKALVFSLGPFPLVSDLLFFFSLFQQAGFLSDSGHQRQGIAQEQTMLLTVKQGDRSRHDRKAHALPFSNERRRCASPSLVTAPS